MRTCHLQSYPSLLAVVLMSVLLASLATPSWSRPSSSEVENMAEALRYLEQIDKVYSQMARPRFGRSTNFHSNYRPSVAGDDESLIQLSKQLRR